MLKNWFKIFIYNAIKNKGFTFLTIFGLAIGITGVIFSTLYWDDETSYEQWNPNKDNVFEVVSTLGHADEYWPSSVEPLPRFLVEKTDKVADYTWFNGWYGNGLYIVNNQKTILNKSLTVQNNFFDFIPFEFVKGSKTDFGKNKNGVAIEENEAIRLFGNQNPINQIITSLEGKQFVIHGVYKLPKHSSFQPKYVMSDIYDRLEENKDEWGNYGTSLLIKLKDIEDKTAIEKICNDILYENKTVRFAKEEGITVEESIKLYGKTETILQSLADARLKAIVSRLPEGQGNKTFLQINLGLSVLILILSIINYVNLSTAQAIRRAKEVGVRKVLGASKQNIILQFVFETALLTLFALLFALSLTELTLPFYNEQIGENLELNFVAFFPYLIAIFSIVVILAGFFPALYIANFEQLKVLKGNFSRSKSGIWLRNSMLVLQFLIATFFITGGLIVTEQVNHMLKKDLGFKSDQIISVNYRKYNLREKRYDFYQSFKQDLLKVKGVKEANAIAFRFGSGGASSDSGFVLNEKMIQGENMAIDFGFFDMMHIKIKEGRDLSPEISSDTISNVLLNEAAIRETGKDVEIGSEFEWNGTKFTLVGIVKDFNLRSPESKIPPMLFMHFKTIKWMSFNMNAILVKVDSEDVDQTIANLEKFWKQRVDQDYPFEYDFVDKQFARSYENYIKQQKMFNILNVVVITIALFGLFALSSYTIERKYKEIAIRKVMGAETKTLLFILSKQYVYLAMIGFVLAVIPSYILMQKWLESFVYRIDISVFTYLFAFVLLLVLTLIVVLLKAYSATKINLLNYLKYE